PPRLRDDDVDPLAHRGQKERRVIGDPRARRRQRRIVRNAHQDRRASMHASQVTCAAISLPARPHAFASSTCAARYAHAWASSRASGATTTPVRRSWTISSGPPASVVVTTGFDERNASNGTIPKSSSTGA